MLKKLKYVLRVRNRIEHHHILHRFHIRKIHSLANTYKKWCIPWCLLQRDISFMSIWCLSDALLIRAGTLTGCRTYIFLQIYMLFFYILHPLIAGGSEIRRLLAEMSNFSRVPPPWRFRARPNRKLMVPSYRGRSPQNGAPFREIGAWVTFLNHAVCRAIKKTQ